MSKTSDTTPLLDPDAQASSDAEEEEASTNDEGIRRSIQCDADKLLDHIGERAPDAKEGEGYENKNGVVAAFFLENTPYAPRGAKCKLASCGDIIRAGDYRVALVPGRVQSAEYYHLPCFEKIADFSDTNFLDRLQATTNRTADWRGLTEPQALDGQYFLDAGSLKLFVHWKLQRGRWIDERDGLSPSEVLELKDKVEGKWHVVEAYLNTDPQSFFDRHDLSKMMVQWKKDARLARIPDEQLTKEGKEAKAELGKDAIEGIQALDYVHVSGGIQIVG